MSKRSAKFYNKNEKWLMKLLGFKPTYASGAGWLEKEDGENDDAVVQLKSTDALSFKLQLHDLKKLEYNAALRKKVPIFINQCLQTGDIYVTINILDVKNFQRLTLGQPIVADDVVIEDEQIQAPKKLVKSSPGSREEFYKERDEQWQKKRR